MTKTKSTKRALLMSMLSMLLCIAMLVGSTFAWFTDSVTSGNNKIVAGNLDVEMEYSVLGADGTRSWKPVTEKTPLFEESALWEPGYTQVVYLKISNVGSLSLNYKLLIDIASEKIGKGRSYEGGSHEYDILLSDYLKFGVVTTDKENFYKTRAEAREAVEATAGKLRDYTATGSIKASEAKDDIDYIALVVYMPETVGNEANYYKNFAPEIELGIKLVATQMVDESDSFGNDYDTDASPKESTAFADLTQENFTVASEADLLKLQELVFNGNTFEGKTITLSEDITLSQANWTPIGSAVAPFKGTFDGNGKTISNLKITKATNGIAGLFGQIEGAAIKDLTVAGDITLDNESEIGDISEVPVGGICATAKDATISGCTNEVEIDVTGLTEHSIANSMMFIGGILGVSISNSAAEPVIISNCTNSANLSGPNDMAKGILSYVGGITTTIKYAHVTITDCVNNGTLAGTFSHPDGLHADFRA